MGRISKEKRDIYFHLAKEDGWRARSAFKLMEINEDFYIFDGVTRAVDLCASPGGWSQVLSQRLRNPEGRKAEIVAVDLLSMAPLPGIKQLQGDITKKNTACNIMKYFEGHKADLVVCDGAPDVSGLHDVDEYMQEQLLMAALNITMHILKDTGTFVGKIFRAKDMDIVLSKLRTCFQNVTVAKPKSSRNSSLEAFIVCEKYCYNDRCGSLILKPLKTDLLCEDYHCTVPFQSCGSSVSYDADTSYSYEVTPWEYSEPIQKPISPPYAESLTLRKNHELESLCNNWKYKTEFGPEIPLESEY